MGVPYFIKENLWKSASDEATLKKFFGGCKPSSKLNLKTKWCNRCGYCDDFWSCERLKKPVVNKYFEKERVGPWILMTFCCRKCKLPLQYLRMVSTWNICLTEILEEKHLKLSDYLNQIPGPSATLSTLQYLE